MRGTHTDSSISPSVVALVVGLGLIGAGAALGVSSGTVSWPTGLTFAATAVHGLQAARGAVRTLLESIGR